MVVHNGDAIENNHHMTTQIITPEVEEQKRIHLAAMDHALQKVNLRKDDKLFYVYGTTTHVHGSEDAIARDLDAEPLIKPTAANNWRDGRFVHHHLKLNINGVRFDIAHHGLNAGGRAWTKENGVAYAIKSMYFNALLGGYKPPDYVVRSHMHEFVTAEYNGEIRGFITPAFQLKTHYGHRVANMKLSSIGMLIFVIEADGRHYWECPRVTFDEIGEIKL